MSTVKKEALNGQGKITPKAESKKQLPPSKQAPKQPKQPTPEEWEKLQRELSAAQNTALTLSSELKTAKTELQRRQPTNLAELQSKAVAIYKLNEKLSKIQAKRRELELYKFSGSDIEEVTLKAGDNEFISTHSRLLQKVKETISDYLKEAEEETQKSLNNAFYFA